MKKMILLVLLASLCKISHAQVLIAILFGDKLNTGKNGIWYYCKSGFNRDY